MTWLKVPPLLAGGLSGGVTNSGLFQVAAEPRLPSGKA